MFCFVLFSLVVIIFLKSLVSCQDKIQTNSHIRIRVMQDIYLPCLPQSPSFSLAPVPPPPPLYAMWRIIFIPSTNLLKKTLYFFHEFMTKCYLSKVYLHFILNLISDCGSKEFNTLLRGF